MKQTDIAAVILIAVLATLGAYWAVDQAFGDPFKKVEKVEYMDAVSDGLTEPDSEVFNRKAINPTVEVTIGQDQQPVEPETPTEAEGPTDTTTSTDGEAQ
jgi:hypothetical protein